MSFAYLALYTGDYLRDTRHLTPMRHGVYLLLLMHCWDQRGPLPLDEEDCAGIANCRSADELAALRYVLNRFFIRMEDGFYNKRMQAEIEKAHAIHLKRKDAGAKGYQAKAKHLPSKSLASASTTTTTTIPPPPPPPAPAKPLAPGAVAPSPSGRAEPSLAEQKEHPPEVIDTTVGVPVPRASKNRQVNGHNREGKTSGVWQAYSTAYVDRYGIEPVRNAKVNAMLGKLVERLGIEEAPQVSAWYVGHQERMDYVRARHCVDLLLRDAEGLRTEWKRGEAVTATQARMTDETATRVNVFRKLMNETKG